MSTESCFLKINEKLQIVSKVVPFETIVVMLWNNKQVLSIGCKHFTVFIVHCCLYYVREAVAPHLVIYLAIKQLHVHQPILGPCLSLWIRGNLTVLIVFLSFILCSKLYIICLLFFYVYFVTRFVKSCLLIKELCGFQ